MASGDSLFTAGARSGVPPGTLSATHDIRVGGSTPAESVPVLDFDDGTIEYIDFYIKVPQAYGGGGLTLKLGWSATSATTGDVVWGAAFRSMELDSEDIDASHTYDYNDASATTTASATGEKVETTITFTDGADMDSAGAGDSAVLRIRRNATDGGDTMSGDAELWDVEVLET